MEGIGSDGPAPDSAGKMRSLARLVREQVDDVLAARSSLTADDRRAIVERVYGLVARSLRQLSPEELARVWAIFGPRPVKDDPEPPSGDDER